MASYTRTGILLLSLLLALIVQLEQSTTAAPFDSEPPSLAELSRIQHLGGEFTDLFIQSSYAYLGLSHGFTILDISNQAQPRPLGSVPLPGLVQDVVVDGNLAYVVAGDAGLLLIDVTDRTAPWVAGAYDTAGNARQVRVAGTSAYVQEDTVLRIIDVSSVAAPIEIGSYQTPKDLIPDLVGAAGNYIYYISGFSLYVLDISNPATPVQISSFNLVLPVYGWGSYGSRPKAEVVEQYAYVATTQGDQYDKAYLQIVDLSHPAAPTRVSYIDLGSSFADSLDIAGNYAYAGISTVYKGGGSSKHMSIINIGNPASPTGTGFVEKPPRIDNLTVGGGYAYTIDPAVGLQRVNVANPAAPVLVEPYDLLRSVSGVTIEGPHAYLATQRGLEIFDVADPRMPLAISSFPVPDLRYIATKHPYPYMLSGTRCSISNPYPGYSYRSCSHNLLQIIDVSQPITPRSVGSVEMPGSAGMAVLRDNYAYVAAGTSGLQVVDISNPTTPQLSGTLDTPGDSRRLALAGNYAYMFDTSALNNEQWSQGGLYVIDISNPSAPRQLGFHELRYNESTNGTSLVVNGNHVYLSNGQSPGIRVFDVTQPAKPTEVNFYIPSYEPVLRLSIVGKYLYAADGTHMHMLDVSEPRFPSPVAVYRMPPGLVASTSSNLYVAAGSGGLLVFGRCRTMPTCRLCGMS